MRHKHQINQDPSHLYNHSTQKRQNFNHWTLYNHDSFVQKWLNVHQNRDGILWARQWTFSFH